MSKKEFPKDLTTVTVDPVTDMTPAELAKIQEFVDGGKLGIATVKDTELVRMMDLYLSGKSYSQISQIMRINKATILYLSHKFDWYPMRQEYLAELERTLATRLIEAKLSSKDFLLQLTHAWQKKIGRKVQAFLRTDDDAHASEIDLKEVDKYLKTVEMLHKLSLDPRPMSEKAPIIGLHLGDGVTVKHIGDKIDITPKQSTIKNKLKEYAEFRRAQSEETEKSKSDIDKDDKQNPQGEEVNEEE